MSQRDVSQWLHIRHYSWVAGHIRHTEELLLVVSSTLSMAFVLTSRIERPKPGFNNVFSVMRLFICRQQLCQQVWWPTDLNLIPM